MRPQATAPASRTYLKAPRRTMNTTHFAFSQREGSSAFKAFHAVCTNEIKHAARVLSRYRDARRTRILRIRLRLTVRVKKTDCQTTVCINTHNHSDAPYVGIIQIRLMGRQLKSVLSARCIGLPSLFLLIFLKRSALTSLL